MPLFPLPFSVSFSPIISCFLPSLMAASSNLHPHKTNSSSSTTFDPAISLPIPNTTFVQANPSNFRAVVQKLTGAPPPPQDSLSVPKPTRLAGKSNSCEMGPRRPVFKLHERRLQSAARKLEIKLNNDNGGGSGGGLSPVEFSPSSSCYSNKLKSCSTGFGGEMVMVSPVSPLELLGRGSPRTPPYKSSSSSPMAIEDEEMKGIAEKGFYLHPSPLSTPRGGGGGAAEPPELLPLFPLHSPTTDHHTSSS